MPKIRSTLPRIVAMADQLQDDIRRRNLQPGDPYYTTQGASRFLGVAGIVANRALQLLEKRKVIERRQKRGAVISTPTPIHANVIERIHFLVHENYLRTEGVGDDGILLGLQEEHPTAAVEHYFLKNGEEEQQVELLVRDAIAQGGTDAFVLVRAPFGVQKIISDSSLPAVIFGTRYPGIFGLAQLEKDHVNTANLVARHLRREQKTNVVLFYRNRILHGDHIELDAFARFRDFAFTARFLPSDDECIKAMAGMLLHCSPRPDAFVCMTIRQADRVAEVLAEQGLKSGDDVELIALSCYLRENQKPICHYIAADLFPEQTGRRIGQLLNRHFMNEPIRDEIIPVRLVTV